ncbi:Uncharacterised protein [Kluyvera intermedia]|nr:Uncharacterised protein [Kluyvera intermedia]
MGVGDAVAVRIHGAGELLAVNYCGGIQVRGFLSDPNHSGRQMGHRYAGRPQTRCRYDEMGRVTEQLNPMT